MTSLVTRAMEIVEYFCINIFALTSPFVLDFLGIFLWCWMQRFEVIKYTGMYIYIFMPEHTTYSDVTNWATSMCGECTLYSWYLQNIIKTGWELTENTCCSRGCSRIWKTQNIRITFIQRRPNVFDVGPTLYKCYANVLCLLGSHVISLCGLPWHTKIAKILVIYPLNLLG